MCSGWIWEPPPGDAPKRREAWFDFPVLIMDSNISSAVMRMGML